MSLVRKETKAAQDIIEQQKTPLMRYQEGVTGLGNALSKGLLDQKQYATAISQLRQEQLSGIPVLGRFASLLTPQGAAFAAAGAAATIAAAGVGVFVERFRAIDALGDTAERLGLSASALSKLHIQAELSDVPIEALDKGLAKMLVTVAKAATEGGDAAKPFKALGLEATKLVEMAPERIIETIAAKIRELPTQAERLNMLREIAGKGGAELATLAKRFAETGLEAEKTGAIVDEQLAKQMGDLDENTKKLRLTFVGLANTWAQIVGPTAVQLSEDLLLISQNRQALMSMLGMATTLVNPAAAVLMLGTQAKETKKLANATAELTAEQQKAKNLETAMKEEDGGGESKESVKFLEQQRKLSEELGLSRDEVTRLRAEQMGLTDEQRTQLDNILASNEAYEEQARLLKDSEKALHDALEEEKRIRKEISDMQKRDADDAKRLLESLKAPDELAADRLRRAKELIGVEGFTEEDFGRLLQREAKAISGPDAERTLSPTLRGSQADIAKTLGQQGKEDSERLDTIISRLEKLIDKEPIAIEEVSF